MKNKIIRLILICSFSYFYILTTAQNVGISTTTPEGKLHVKGSANVTQLIIDASSTQSNLNPLIKLRNSSGTELLWISSDAQFNTFIGLNSGNANYASGGGNYNTFIGGFAGYYNTIGNLNSAIGSDALHNNTTASGNTAIGTNALFSQSYNPGASWTSGNTAVGNNALYSNQPTSNQNGLNNTAIGSHALTDNTIGWDNTGIGVTALYSNADGVRNTAVGRQSLFYNISGDDNTATGYKALRTNSTGIFNTATGSTALHDNVTGSVNTADGYLSLHNNDSGDNNTGIGGSALYNNTSGNQNAALGSHAGYNNTGSQNTFIGYGSDANGNGYGQSTAIGYNTTFSASNQVRIGFFASSIGGPQNWTNTSDGRIKINIRDDVQGLVFIERLHPVTYNKSLQLENEILGRKEITELPADNTYEKIRYSGFIAQEVEKSAKEIGYDFSGVDPPKNDKDLYGLRYAEFVVPLVKAVQEQQVMINELKTANQELLVRLEALEKRNP